MNILGPEGAAALSPGIFANGSLTVLDISGNQIGDESMRAIGKSLLSSVTSKLGALKCDAFNLPVAAKSLNLSNKGINPAAATLLAGVIKFNGSLTSLDIRANWLDGEGKDVIRKAVEGREGFDLKL